MSSHFQSSGPRSNAFSVSKCSNFAAYEPFDLEVNAVRKRYEHLLPKAPEFPEVLALPRFAPHFVHPCSREEVIHRLRRMPPECVAGLRGVFLLAGTRKQLRGSARGQVYGVYWRDCIYLCAVAFERAGCLDTLRDFYLNDVLVHEVAHHLDRRPHANVASKEAFAEKFVEQKRA